MRRELGILLATVFVGAAWTWVPRVPEALSTMEAFRVTAVEIQGLRYLTRSDVLETIGVEPRTSVWGDLDTWSEALRAHPMVQTATVTAGSPARLWYRSMNAYPWPWYRRRRSSRLTKKGCDFRSIRPSTGWIYRLWRWTESLQPVRDCCPLKRANSWPRSVASCASTQRSYRWCLRCGGESTGQSSRAVPSQTWSSCCLSVRRRTAYARA
jgi:hypothetical protein